MPGRPRPAAAAGAARARPRVARPAAAYEQVAEHYRRKIRKGELSTGQRFPSIRAIAKTWSVSTRTAWLAVNMLRKEGLIAHRQGAQPVVLDKPAQPRSDPSMRTGQPLGSPRRARAREQASGSGRSAEEMWLSAHRRSILAVAREALEYRHLGSARAMEGLDEVAEDVRARRVTPGSVAGLHQSLVDLRFSPAVQAEPSDHPVYLLVDRWSTLHAGHPGQRA